MFNRRAVAVASDSVVSVDQGPRRRTHPGADKLFEIPGHPVLVLHSGSAYFMSVPYESFIQTWAADLPGRLASIDDYSAHFTSWLEEQRSLRPEPSEAEVFRWLLEDVYIDVRRRIVSDIDEPDLYDKPWDHHHVVSVVTEAVRTELRRLEECPERGRDAAGDDRWVEEHGQVVREAFERILDEVPHSEAGDRMLLTDFPRLVLSRAALWDIDSTLMFVGFGAEDLFPGHRAVTVTGVINDQVLWRPYLDGKVQPSRGSLITTLGIDDGVHGFIRGYDYRFLRVAHQHLDGVLDEVAGDPDAEDKRQEHHDALAERFSDYSYDTFTGPLLDVMEGLPRAQLASLAESLVRIEALRQFTCDQQPTVGGPFDVAAITRDGGVEWVVRQDVRVA